MISVASYQTISDKIFQQLFAFCKSLPSEDAYMDAYMWAIKRLDYADKYNMNMVYYFTETRTLQDGDNKLLMDSKKTLFGWKYLYLITQYAVIPSDTINKETNMAMNLIIGSKEWAIEKSKMGFIVAVKTTKWNSDEPFEGWVTLTTPEIVEQSKYTEGWYLYDVEYGFFRPQYDITTIKEN